MAMAGVTTVRLGSCDYSRFSLNNVPSDILTGRPKIFFRSFILFQLNNLTC